MAAPASAAPAQAAPSLAHPAAAGPSAAVASPAAVASAAPAAAAAVRASSQLAAPARARLMVALQQSVGNARAGRMVSSVQPPSAGEPPAEMGARPAAELPRPAALPDGAGALSVRAIDQAEKRVQSLGLASAAGPAAAPAPAPTRGITRAGSAAAAEPPAAAPAAVSTAAAVSPAAGAPSPAAQPAAARTGGPASADAAVLAAAASRVQPAAPATTADGSAAEGRQPALRITHAAPAPVPAARTPAPAEAARAGGGGGGGGGAARAEPSAPAEAGGGGAAAAGPEGAVSPDVAANFGEPLPPAAPAPASSESEGERKGGWTIRKALDWVADKANYIPGFRMLTIIIGVNPINWSRVERTAGNVLRAVIEFIPGGKIITDALEKHGIFDRVGGWVDKQLRTLKMTGRMFKDALFEFLDSLSLSDLANLGGVWDRAKRIFTEPVERIKNFVVGLVTQIGQFVRQVVLMPLARLAEGTRGYDLLKAVLGQDPVTGQPVPRNAQTLVGGFMKLIGQEELWENIRKANALARVWAWFQGALSELVAFVKQIPRMFIAALRSLEIMDLILIPRAFAKLIRVFGDFVLRFIKWAGNTVWKLLEIVFEVVAPKVMPYLKKAAGAFRTILKNPIRFVSSLVKAAKLGFQKFADNFKGHLIAGLIDWLTGSLTGVYIPKALNLAEIGKFALSVLGISWAQIRAKIVKALGDKGEMIMKALETGFDIVVALVKGGPAAAWEVIKEKLTNLKDMVIEGITGFVIDLVVKKAIPKLISLFIPGAGFISAIMTIYDTIMVFVEKISKIIQVVTAFLDSIMAIAGGQLEGAAKKVESILAGLLSLAISFLAGFLSLGRITDKILALVEKVRAVVDKALDKAIEWIVGKAKVLFAKLFGKKGKPDERTDEQKKADLDKAVADAEKLQNDPKKSDKEIKKNLNEIKQKYKLTSIEFIIDSQDDAKEKVHIDAKINPEKSTNQTTKELDGFFEVSAVGEKPPAGSSVGALPAQSVNSPGTYEERVGTSLEGATGLKAEKGVLPKKVTKDLSLLLKEPTIGDVPGLIKKPDYLLFSGGKIEVFEVTLDVGFSLDRPTPTSGISHKRLQLAGNVFLLSQKYGNVPIIYNIRAPKEATDQVKKEIIFELRNLRKQYKGVDIQVVWRS